MKNHILHCIISFLKSTSAKWLLPICGLFVATTNDLAQQLPWSFQDSPTTVFLNEVFFADSSYGWAVGGGVSNVIVHTANSGVNWSLQSSPTPRSLESCQFLNRNVGWAAGGNCFTNQTAQGVIIKTTNAGQLWSIQMTDNQFMMHSVHFIDGNYGWAAGEDYQEANGSNGHTAIFKTTDGGQTWNSSDLSLLGQGLKDVYFIDRDHGWSVGQYGTVLHTTNGGTSWNTQSSATQAWLYSVYFLDRDTGWIAGDCFKCSSLRGVVLKTTDAGTTWINQGIPGNYGFRSIHFVDKQNGWATGPGGIIIHTSNGGDVWVTQSVPVVGWLNSIYFSDVNQGWAVGDSGRILKTVNGGLTSVENNDFTPNTFSLSQNFPNPFNPSTSISFSIPLSAYVSLRVYNMLGEEVSTLVSEKLNAGTYKSSWNASGIPSGVYFYRLSAGLYSETKKLVLLK